MLVWVGMGKNGLFWTCFYHYGSGWKYVLAVGPYQAATRYPVRLVLSMIYCRSGRAVCPAPRIHPGSGPGCGLQQWVAGGYEVLGRDGFFGVWIFDETFVITGARHRRFRPGASRISPTRTHASCHTRWDQGCPTHPKNPKNLFTESPRDYAEF